MAAAQQGDATSYRCLLEALVPYLRRCHEAECRPADADDLTQETLLAIHLKRATYDPSQPLLPWVKAIARYKRIDFYRRRARLREELLTHTSDKPHRDKNASQHEDHDFLCRLMDRLPESQAEAIRLVRLQGLSIREAAEHLNKSPSWIKVNIHRGIKTMKADAERDNT
ncbi:sigma-70 family RNA polymerase sigma factor [Mucisphaera sp.]|uniref:sigma-70 family RNA polymerase sigma factor n=1 Tax=Mucisphaera sp. TaxID=2913024 RepID=UPI003D124F97